MQLLEFPIISQRWKNPKKSQIQKSQPQQINVNQIESMPDKNNNEEPLSYITSNRE